MFRTLALLCFALPSCSFAQPQPQDEEFSRMVKQWTTKPEFSSPLVDHLPKVAGIPQPKDVLGYHIGTPKKLTHAADIYRYYRALAAASPRVKVISTGTTDENRECVMIAISSEENIQNLETNKRQLARLADPRQTTEAQAKEIIATAKPIYLFGGGLHSAETGPSEMLMELAYRLAAEQSPLYDRIRKNVVVMIAPVWDPDGRDRYVEWYQKYKLTEETEADRLPGPPYWGKYIFHDNNRDINYSQVTMRNWLKFYLEWHPPIIHDLHESVPFLYTFSGQAPQNPTLDPLLYAELPWFSNFEMTKMIAYGMPGVWTHGFVDMWSPGYLGFMSSNHNGLLRMYETFGNGGANTMRRNVDAGEGGAPAAASQTTREWYRPLPPYKTVEWSMRNNTNYMETGVLSALELAAGFPSTILENFYKKSRNSVESGKSEAPFGYVIPSGQSDMTRVAFIVNTLRLQGIEVGRASAEIKLKEGTYPPGSFVVKRDQPYGRLAKILLEKQQFPDPNLRTYDDTGWTMGLMNHARVEEIADKALLTVPAPLVDSYTVEGTITGTGQLLAVLQNGANALTTLRYRLPTVKFEALNQASGALPAGSFLISDSPAVRTQIALLGLKAVALSAMPEAPRHAVDLPRLAVFTTWGSTQEVGWVRHAFDRFEVKYDLIYKERVRKGGLRAQYDVIVIPSQGRAGAKSLVYDIESKGKPLAYTKSTEFPSLGSYGESEDITGGMGLPGVAEFDKFVSEGGTLVTLGVSSYLPAEFGLVRQVDAARPTAQFYAPGPIVEVEAIQTGSSILYGYTEKLIPVRYANGPLLRVPEEQSKWVVARFTGLEKSVLSGLMKNPAETRNRAAVIDAPVGQGRIVMFATNPCYRWQNFGEFGMLFNAVLHRTI